MEANLVLLNRGAGDSVVATLRRPAQLTSSDKLQAEAIPMASLNAVHDDDTYIPITSSRSVTPSGDSCGRTP